MDLIILLFITYIGLKIYEAVYYKSSKFLSMKEKIETHINNCNELNAHIEELKNTYLGIDKLDYGCSIYQDKSRWNYKRIELNKQKYAPNIYNCSRTVCDNARKQPFKYICKYFNIKPNEENLIKFEEVLNNFEAVEDGKIMLRKEKKQILESIKKDIPVLITFCGKKNLEKKLGFVEVDFDTIYFPRYIFKYISSGGNASLQCDVIMDINNLNQFIKYLSETIKFKKSVAGQRALMTSALRRKILHRDSYTCKHCGNSTMQEPNLLLEVDHVIPIAKGGLTTENNLQTLCWKCNRRKGSKIMVNQ